MKNKKGFTLIELLAVIVVLAIIALIATPIVMNTIKNAQKGAAERTADNYIKQVETTIAEKKLENNPLADGPYTIDDNGNLTRNGLTESVTIDMNGTKPSRGTVKISNGGVSKEETTMTVGDYNVKYNQENNKYEASEKGNTSLICDLQEGTSQTVGAKYTCHLDSDRIFYVLETSGDNVSLIMDRNFTDDTVPITLAWCVDGGSDGSTCKNINSKKEGTPLKHIQDLFGTNVTVSFPTANQLATVSGEKFDGLYIVSKLASWLYDYLEDTTNPVPDVKGYWTATPRASDTKLAWDANCRGDIDYDYVNNSSYYVIRPVITISKSNLSQ